MLTFAEAKATKRLVKASGVCADSEEFKDYLNTGTEDLMRRGNWWGTVKSMQGCIYNGCITWPRAVETVLAFDRCGSVPPKNFWYQYNPVLPQMADHWRRHGSFLCARDMALADQNTSPVFNQIPCGKNLYVRFYPTDMNDVGKTLTIFGVDGNGLEIITTRADGTIQPGVVLALAIPFVQSPMLLRRIDRVLKDQTVRPIYGYQFDGVNQFPLATYAPSETNPEYRTSKLLWSNCPTTNCNQWPSMISALTELKFIPVEVDDDPVLIDNTAALSFAIKAAKLEDAYDSTGRETNMAQAVKELNLELRKKYPIDQTPARVKVFGSATLRRRGIGSLM